jgi:hypothetical protein
MSKRSTQRAPAKKREAERRAAHSGPVRGAARGATGLRESVRRAVATRPRLVAAACLAMVLALVGGSFASYRISRSNKAKQAERAQSLQPQDAGSPSKEYIYLGAGGRLIATEEPAAQVPSAPTNLIVTAVSNTNVRLQWTAPAGQVDHYIVQRRPNINASYAAESGNVLTTTFNDGVDAGIVTPFTTYQYQVVAYNSSGGGSLPSTAVYATAVTFSGNDPVGSSTHVSASQIADLRQAVNAMRVAAGLAQINCVGTGTCWTHNAHQFDPVYAADIADLRKYLDPAISGLGFSPKGYTNGLTPQVTQIHAVDVNEIRLRIEWYR